MVAARSHERSPSTTRTSLATFTRVLRPRSITRETIIDTQHGDETGGGPLELRDVLTIETTDGKHDDFEIVALLEDEDDGSGYAIAYSEGSDQFIVTDGGGKLLENDELAQEILDDYLVFAEESAGGD